MFGRKHASRVGGSFTVKNDRGSRLLIISVPYNGHDEARHVVAEVANGRRPRTVGIELPKDYEERDAAGMKASIFSEIAKSLKSNGVHVVPLEPTECFNLAQAWNVAKKIESGKIGIEDVRQIYESGRRERDNPDNEIKARSKRTVEVFGRAISMFEKFNGNKEGFSKLLASIKQLQTTEMIAAARLHRVDTIIVSTSHANEISKAFDTFTHLNSKKSETATSS